MKHEIEILFAHPSLLRVHMKASDMFGQVRA